ncbi:MAG: hypothetical protein JST30_12765 [Armatimonadetes bacterium]|nr:hypothetical protein [Armatimonadota bacterium]
MRHMLSLAVFAALILGAGCGGSSQLGNSSDMVVRLVRTDTSQDLMQYEVYITRNADATLDVNNPEDFASTQNTPSWVDQYQSNRMSRQLTLGFRTVNQFTPYYVWIKVPNGANATENLQLQIDMDANNGPLKMITVNNDSTERLVGVRIERNEAFY